MSDAASIPRVFREGDVVAIAVDERSLSLSVPQAKHLIRAVNSVAPVFGLNATVETQYLDIIARSRVQLPNDLADKYLTNTGRTTEDGWVTGAMVHVGNESWLVDHASLEGTGLLRLETPLQPCGHRVVPTGAITCIAFDSE